MQLTVSVLLSTVAALVSLGVTVVAWRFRDTDGVRELIAFNLGTVVWTAGNAAQHFAVSEGAKLFWVNVQYVGIAGLPVAVYAFACQFTNRERWARGRRLAAVAVPLAALVVLTWTNEWHHLVRTETVRVAEQPGIVVESFVELDRSGAWGPAFWVGWGYSQLVLVVSTALLLRGVLYTQDIFQRQAAALLVGAVVPWVGQVLYLSGVSPLEPEVFFAVSGGAFLYAVVRHEMLDLLPVARDAVIEMMTDGVVVVDTKGRVVDMNDAASGILGQPAAEVVGSGATRVFADFPDLRACYERREGKDDVVLGSGGAERHYDVAVSTFAGDHGSGRSGTVIVMHDITALRNREAELERQNEQLEMVADTLSHDLRNPLNVAAGFLERARTTGGDDAFDRVERSHDRMEDIIEDVLTLARYDEDIDPAPVPLPAAAEDAWSHVETGDSDLVVTDTVTVRADRGQLLTLFENLFRNSVEHGGPAVTVRVGPLDGGFFVEDDGPGIPESDRDEVFEHGYTTNTDGTGFGLSIVSRVAAAHDWEIRVVEGSAGGARFEVTGVEHEAGGPEPAAPVGG